MRLRSALALSVLLACESTEGLTGGAPLDSGAADAEAAAPFCAAKTGAAACASFDGQSLDPGWTTNSMNGGAVSLDTAKAVSVPGSLLATTQTLTVSRNATAVARHGLPPWSSRATVDVDVLVEQVDANSASGAAAILTLELTPDGPGVIGAKVAIGISAIASALIDTTGVGGVATTPLGRGFTKGMWTHVTVVVDATTGKVSGSLDGESLGEAPLKRAVKPTVSSVGLGVAVTGPAESWAVRFDNVVVRVE